MNTTNLFVELIVIGIGAAGWVSLLIAATTNIDLQSVFTLANRPVAAISILAFVYLLGIITDRLADWLFHVLRMELKRQKTYPGESEQFYKDRALVLSKSDQFTQQYEYSRSRQRICRGWTLNPIALIVSFNIFHVVRDGGFALRERLVISTLLLIVAFSSWLAWELMSTTELKRIKQQADCLRTLEK